MEIKSLILGLVFSVGVFAVKVGLGLQYHRAIGPRNVRARLAETAWVLAYGALFTGAALAVDHLDLAGRYGSLLTVARGGMLIHLAMAALLFAWGLALIRRSPRRRFSSRGWWLLVMPCPVCLLVILFTVAFLALYAPEHLWAAVLAAYLGFLALTLVGRLIFAATGAGPGRSPESRLGMVMLAVAAYFLLAVTIMPQFADLDRVYRLAAYTGRETGMNLQTLIPTVVLSAAVFVTGFVIMKRKMGQRA